MLEEEIDGCEISLSSFVVAEYEGQVVAARGGWLEGENEDRMPSALLKSNLFAYVIPKDILIRGSEHADIVHDIQIDREMGTYQLENSYTKAEFRGLHIMAKLDKYHLDLAKEKGYDIGFYKFDRLTVSEPHIYERWIVWDNYIEEEIKYLLDNANTHSEEKISLEDYPDSPKHKVWLQVEYDMDKQEMFLSMFNKCKALKAKEISKETRKKTRFGITHLKEEMKVKVEYVDCENHIIQTRITFKLI